MELKPEQIEAIQTFQVASDIEIFKNEFERPAREKLAIGCKYILHAQEIRKQYTKEMHEAGRWASFYKAYLEILNFPIPLLKEDGQIPYTVGEISLELEAEFDAWFVKVVEAQKAAETVGVTLFRGLPGLSEKGGEVE